IASFHWSWRLLLATGDARYADLMERVLYNAFGASISTDGQRFFYVNPLQRRSDHVEGDDPARRHEWFSCACCPPNIMRLLASLQHYLATTAGATLFVHQFTGAEIAAPLAGGTLGVVLSTDLPWSGEVTLRVTQAPAGPAGLALRVPAWTGTPRLRVNGELTDPGPARRGYLTVTRVWQPGDVLAWTFDLTPRWVYPHPRIDSVRGCVAVERGPLVYCFEQVDQAHELDDLALAAGTGLAERAATLPEIGRTVLVEADAKPMAVAGAGTQRATAVPYFQWDNRDGRPMRVWLPAIMA
ncbi:MAG TPA: beta-L-arabinofuranosidase domain-containing protein, partial [Streptosporangiaceae bacterium]